jgi:hypothetical protein
MLFPRAEQRSKKGAGALPDGRFFAEPHVEALMTSMLDLTGEVLLLRARQRRLLAAPDPTTVDLSAPLQPDERAWVAARADELVAAWLDPLLRTSSGAEAHHAP